MAKDVGDSLAIMSKVIGDDQSNEVERIQYLSDFITLIMPQDIKIKENFDYFQFTTVANQDVYPLNVAPLPDNEFVNIGEPVYLVNPAVNSTQRIQFYQDPAIFYAKWVLDPTPLSPGVPTDLLFFDNEITLRTVPDNAYDITLIGYKRDPDVDGITDPIVRDYTWRYIAYGASIDWFSDHGQIDQVNLIMPIYNRYRDIVLQRTAEQYINMRAVPAI